jgi:hypothetical protein
MDIVIPIAFIFGVVFTIFWAAQLLDLMRQKDDAFPGRWDKLLWVGIIVFVPIVGAVLYSIRKPREWITKSPPALEREWERIQAERGKARPGEAT